MTLNQTIKSPWSYRRKPEKSCIDGIVSFLGSVGVASHSKVGIQEYEPEDPEKPKTFKVETFTVTWSLNGVGNNNEVQSTDSGSATIVSTYNPKTGALTATSTGDAAHWHDVVAPNPDVSYSYSKINNGQLDSWTNTYEGDAPQYWSVYPYYIPLPDKQNTEGQYIYEGYDAGTGTGVRSSLWKVTSITKTSTSITMFGSQAHGNFSATWTLSEEFTDEELAGYVEELLGEINLTSVPFSDYGGVVSVTARYGKGWNDPDGAQEALDTAQEALDTATSQLATLEATQSAKQSAYESSKSLYEAKRDIFSDAQLEYEKAKNNLDTWTRRKDEAQIATATARANAASTACWTTAAGEYYDALYDYNTKKGQLETAKQAVNNKRLEIEELTYTVDIRQAQLDLANSNESAGEEDITLTISEGGNLQASCTKTNSSIYKTKIRYKLAARMPYVPMQGDPDLKFEWREVTIEDNSYTFLDKTATVTLAESDPVALMGSYWNRIAWTGFYTINAPSSDSVVKPVGLAVKSTVSASIQGIGGIAQKIGFSEYAEPSVPPKIYKTETITNSPSDTDNGWQSFVFEYDTYNYYTSWEGTMPVIRSLHPWTIQGDDRVENEYGTLGDATKTTRVLDDETSLTLSDEFTTSELQEKVNNVYNSDPEEGLSIPYTGIEIPTEIAAYYIFPTDEMSYGKRKIKYRLSISLPSSYGFTKEGDTFSGSYKLYTLDLTTGEVTSSSHTLTLTDTEGGSRGVSQEDSTDLVVTTRNQMQWLGDFQGEDNNRFWGNAICKPVE